MTTTPPLERLQRIRSYRRQTGWKTLTPAQRRRTRKKENRMLKEPS
jgi:hypothetical protein